MALRYLFENRRTIHSVRAYGRLETRDEIKRGPGIALTQKKLPPAAEQSLEKGRFSSREKEKEREESTRGFSRERLCLCRGCVHTEATRGRRVSCFIGHLRRAANIVPGARNAPERATIVATPRARILVLSQVKKRKKKEKKEKARRILPQPSRRRGINPYVPRNNC